MTKSKTRTKVKIVVPLILLALIIVVSGCVGQRPVNTATNDGLMITSFDVDNNELSEGEMATFTLDVENQGGTDASYVRAELSGVEGQWREQSGDLVVDTLPKWGEISLKAPDPQDNLPGDFKTTYWRLKTPDLPQIPYTFSVKAKVTYNYKTTGGIQIRALGQTYYRTEFLAKSKTVDNPMVVTNTNAPVKILLPEKTNPLIIDDTSEGDEMQTFPVRFILQNVGSGFPITEGVPGRFYGKITMGGPFKFRDCLDVQDSSEVEITENNIELAKLRPRSGAVTISCELEVSKSLWQGRQEESINILFDLFYRYYIDKEVSVKVFGR